MAKLYFRHSVMNSGKTTQLLQIAHDYEVNNGKKVLVLKPGTDLKADDYVISRVGDGILKRKCDFLIKPDKRYLLENVIFHKDIENISIILIDESQFLSKANVWDLVRITKELHIPVICFGIRSDFLGNPFEGSSYLFALAEDIEEISTRAISRDDDDNKRATMNMRMINGKPTFSGDQVGIDGKDNATYIPVSLKRFWNEYKKWYKDNKS